MQLDSADDAAETSDREGSGAGSVGDADADALEDDVELEDSDEDPDENVPSENIPDADAPPRQKQATLGSAVARRPPGPSMKSDYKCANHFQFFVHLMHCRMAVTIHRCMGGIMRLQFMSSACTC